jgi:FtsZ-binding cell division protein ZapB
MPAETESRKQLQGRVAGWIRLARLGKLHYAGKVASGGSHLTPLSVDPVAIQIFVQGRRMTRRKMWATLAMAVVLSLPLAACKDTKTLDENEQLKAKVAELQKENGQVGNELEIMTAARDTLAKENEKLKGELKAKKTKHSGKKTATKKHRRS